MTDTDTYVSIARLAELALKLGQVDRATYHPDGKRRETDTDHTVALGLIACAWADQIENPFRRLRVRSAWLPLDLGLVAAFALVHDFPEVHVGDTNSFGISEDARAAKAVREQAAVAQIDSEFRESLPWLPRMIERYERLEDSEARFIKLIDKVAPKLTHALNGCAAFRDKSKAEVYEAHQRQLQELAARFGAEFPQTIALLAWSMREVENTMPETRSTR